MDPVAVSAIAGAIGVVAGSVVSTLGIIFRERLVGQQERANQEALRNQVVSDQRDAFQRETIIELQDALARLWAQSADAFNRAERGPLIDDMPGANDLSARINALRSRLFDDELRDLAGQVMIEIWTGVEAADLSRQPAHMAAARTIKADFEARVTAARQPWWMWGLVPTLQELEVSGRPGSGTATTTGPTPMAVDALQYATGQGPCLDAIRNTGGP